MSVQPGLLMAAVIVDLSLGDPDGAWHPVRLIGRSIRALEARLNRPGRGLRLRGVGLALLVPAGAYLAGLAWLEAARWLAVELSWGAWAYQLAAALLLWSCLGLRSMLDHVRPVLEALAAEDLPAARLAVSRIVGRETAHLDREGVLRACLESVAEGLCDGVLAPLCFAALGGPALALAYRAVNTLDSMVGYKDEQYRDLGWASARLDDLLNWVPARFSALATGLAALGLGLDARAAWRTAWQDGPRQPSPNSGWPEGAFAGALGVRLGGPLRYKGQDQAKAHLGQAQRPLDLERVGQGLRLFLLASVLAAALLEVLAWSLRS